jgi:phosphatidylethanolamine N-methyltransferase
MEQVGANKSTLITKILSFGRWVPAHTDEEWNDSVSLDNTLATSGCPEAEIGTVVFQGSTLPWTVGRYEVRLFLGHCAYT